MKSNFLFLVTLLFLWHQAFVQTTQETGSKKWAASKMTLSGKILHAEDSLPVAGASIYFPDLKKGTVADNHGAYSIPNLYPGNYLIEVSTIGHQSIIEYVSLQTSMEKHFYLKESVVESEGVTVTGVSTATLLKRTAIPVTVLKKTDLLQITASNLIDALSKKNGIAALSTGPAISKPVIRGLGYNRVVVLNDGVRQEGQQWGDEHGIEIDEFSVQKIEILKGPASLMYGSDAMAGVINIHTNVPVSEKTIKGNFYSNYQTNNRQKSFAGNIAGNKNGFNWNAYGSISNAQDYKNKLDGYVFNSKYNQRNVGGYMGYNGQWGYSHIILSSFNQTLGMIEGERDDVTGEFIKETYQNGLAEEVIVTPSDFKGIHPSVPRQQITHNKVAMDNQFLMGSLKLNMNLGYQNNKRKEFGDITAPDKASLFFNLHTFTYNLQLHLPEKNKWKTSIGISGMSQKNNNLAEEVIIPAYSLFDAGAFVYTQKHYKQITWSGGLRVDNRTLQTKAYFEGGALKFVGFHKSFTNISGSAGLSYELQNNVVLKFNIARGFRAPSIPELSSNGAHEGTNRYEYGNNDLQSETSLQLDAGASYQSEHVYFSLSTFVNRIHQFIYYSKLESVNGGDSTVEVDGEAIAAFNFNQQNTLLTGLELRLDIHPHPLDWLHFENNFSLVYGKLDRAIEGTKNLPAIPAARWITQLRSDFLTHGKHIRNLSAMIELDNNFSQNRAFTAFGTETATKGFSILNAGISADILHKNKPLCSIYINALNITDIAYQQHLSRLKYTAINNANGRQGVFNMGRNFSFKINVPIQMLLK